MRTHHKLLSALAVSSLVVGCAADDNNDADTTTPLTASGAATTAAPADTAAGGAATTVADTAAAATTVAEADCELAQGVTDTTIKLGVTTPLSGNAASIGTQHLAAQEAFIETVNAAGGINGRTLEIVSQDDGFDPQRAVTNAQFLMEQEQVFALWGNVGSAPSSAVLPLADAASVPFLFPYALGRDITTPVKTYTYSIATPAYDQNVALSTFMSTDPAFAGKKIGLLVINSPDGAETADGFAAGPSAANVVSTQTYDRGSATFKAQLLEFESAGAEVIYTGVNDAEFAKILSEANEIGLDATFYGSTGAVTAAVFELAGDFIEGSYGLVFVAPVDGPEPGLVDLNAALAEYKPGETAGTFSVHAWASGMLVAEAIEQAGPCLSLENFNAAMQSITDFDTGGLTGPITFNAENHLGNRSIRAVKAEGGTWVTYSDWITPD